MPIPIACSCGKQFLAPDEAAGKVMGCPLCGAKIAVPGGMTQRSPAPMAGAPPQAFPPQGYPPQGFPGHMMPPQGYPPQGTPPQGFAPQGFPPQGFPPPGMPPHGFPQQGMPPQGFQMAGMPPQGFPAGYQGMPAGAFPSGPPQRAKSQGTPLWLWITAGVAGVALLGVFIVVMIYATGQDLGNQQAVIPSAPPPPPGGGGGGGIDGQLDEATFIRQNFTTFGQSLGAPAVAPFTADVLGHQWTMPAGYSEILNAQPHAFFEDQNIAARAWCFTAPDGAFCSVEFQVLPNAGEAMETLDIFNGVMASEYYRSFVGAGRLNGPFPKQIAGRTWSHIEIISRSNGFNYRMDLMLTSVGNSTVFCMVKRCGEQSPIPFPEIDDALNGLKFPS